MYCVIFKGMYASAYHTFSNFVSNSRKLKFRPIIIKRLPKPTFSWYVLQAKSIAFKKVSLLFHLYSLQMLQALQSVSLSRAVFPWEQLTQRHRHSLHVPAPSHGLGTQGWAAGTGYCSLQGWPDLMALWGSPWLHASPGLPPAHLRNGLQDPSASCRPQAQWLVSVTLSERSYNLLVYHMWRGGTHPSMLLHSRGKKTRNAQRNFCLQKASKTNFSDKLKWDEAHFILGNTVVWPDGRPSLLCLPQSQHHGLVLQ